MRAWHQGLPTRDYRAAEGTRAGRFLQLPSEVDAGGAADATTTTLGPTISTVFPVPPGFPPGFPFNTTPGTPTTRPGVPTTRPTPGTTPTTYDPRFPPGFPVR